MEDGDIEGTPVDQDVIEDHRAFIMINGVGRIPANSSNSNNKDRHGDSGIAHLLADYASKNSSAPIEFMPLPSREKMEAHADDYEWISDVGCF